MEAERDAPDHRDWHHHPCHRCGGFLETCRSAPPLGLRLDVTEHDARSQPSPRDALEKSRILALGNLGKAQE